MINKNNYHFYFRIKIKILVYYKKYTLVRFLIFLIHNL